MIQFLYKQLKRMEIWTFLSYFIIFIKQIKNKSKKQKILESMYFFLWSLDDHPVLL